MHGSNASRAIGAAEDCRFDDDGHTLYIELKVTQGSDLQAPDCDQQRGTVAGDGQPTPVRDGLDSPDCPGGLNGAGDSRARAIPDRYDRLATGLERTCLQSASTSTTPSPRGAPRPDAFGRWHNAVMPGRPRHPVTTATTVRSYAPLTLEHLDRLVALATLDHKKFTRPDGRPEYAGLRVAVVLAQGAAQHWVDIDARAADPNGVKDLDVWTFYAARPGAQFPAAKRETHADFGPSNLGRQMYTPADVATLGPRVHPWERYAGRRVDFLLRALTVPPGCPADEAEDAIVKWLTAGARSRSATPPSSWHLSRKAVVGMWPTPLAGRTLWPLPPTADAKRACASRRRKGG